MSMQSIPSLSTTRSLTLTVTQFRSFATPAITVPFPSAYGQTQIPFVFAATPSSPSGPLQTVGAAAAIPRPVETGSVVPSNNGTGAGANGGMLPPRPRAGLPNWALPTIATVGGLAVIFFLVGIYCCCRGRKSKKERARVASERQRSAESHKQESRYEGGSEKYTREMTDESQGWGGENTRGRSNFVRAGVTPSTSNESMRSDGRYPRMSSDSEQPSQSYQNRSHPSQPLSNAYPTPLAPPLAPWERDDRTDSASSFDSIAPLTKGRSGRTRGDGTRTRTESAVRVRGDEGRDSTGEREQRQRGVDHRSHSGNRSFPQPRTNDDEFERPRSAQSRARHDPNGFVAGGRDTRRQGMPPMERQRSAPAVPTQRLMSETNDGRRSNQGGARESQALMTDRFSGSDSPPRRLTRPASFSTPSSSRYSSQTQPQDSPQDSELAYNTRYNSQPGPQERRDDFIPPSRYRPQRSRTESPQRPEKSLHRPPPTIAARERSRERTLSAEASGVQGPRAMRSDFDEAEVDEYAVV